MRALSERGLLFLIAAIQFVNILDFMMVMPMGPDFAKALGIPVSQLGVIGGSYTAAAAVAGLAGVFFLDRFDRRKALLVALTGLVLSTAAGALAQGLPSLVAARVAAGLFGGPATSISQAIVADVVPADRRGKAMGIVMSAFSVASVLGVPLGLELSRIAGWHAPFVFVAALGFLVTALAAGLLPSMRGHLQREQAHGIPWHLVTNPLPSTSLLATTVTTCGVFLLVPNLSAFLQFNLGYPRDRLGLLYLIGGTLGFLANGLIGRWVDRVGSVPVAIAGTALHVLVLWCGMIQPIAAIPVAVIFVGFMLSGSFRMLPMSALSSRVPVPSERAGFLSLQSVVQHLASAVGAVASSRLLIAEPSGRLQRFPETAALAALFALAMPLLLWRASRLLSLRERAKAAAG
ncbi:MAG: MFS transporter [Polyangiaceae bacterium]|jgi:predicted MFS family arabinose efflux permease|nr:MFS transporter [Polyangiaceae bacterium]